MLANDQRKLAHLMLSLVFCTLGWSSRLDAQIQDSLSLTNGVYAGGGELTLANFDSPLSVRYIVVYPDTTFIIRPEIGRFKNLSEIELHLGKSGLIHIDTAIQHLPKLHTITLDLPEDRGITAWQHSDSIALCKLLSNPHIKKVQIYGAPKTGVPGLDQLRGVEELVLPSWVWVNSRLPALESLRALTFNDDTFEMDSLPENVYSLPHLRSLRIGGTDDMLELGSPLERSTGHSRKYPPIAKAMEAVKISPKVLSMRHLMSLGSDYRLTLPPGFQYMPNLVQLRLVEPSAEDIATLAQMPKLERLEFLVTDTTPSTMRLCPLKQLRHLSIVALRRPTVLLGLIPECLTEFPELHSLSLIHSWQAEDYYSDFGQGFMPEWWGELLQLDSLVLVGSRLLEMAPLYHCSRLRYLHIDNMASFYVSQDIRRLKRLRVCHVLGGTGLDAILDAPHTPAFKRWIRRFRRTGYSFKMWE